jgi:hypothetical protein
MLNSANRTPFGIKFVKTKPRMLLELTNTSETPLKSVEILTIFLKDEGIPGTTTRTHIRFEQVRYVQSKESTILSHKTWINGRPASDSQDQLGRLEDVAGSVKPYVLHISWEDTEGKTQFQRIPCGH